MSQGQIEVSTEQMKEDAGKATVLETETTVSAG